MVKYITSPVYLCKNHYWSSQTIWQDEDHRYNKVRPTKYVSLIVVLKSIAYVSVYSTLYDIFSRLGKKCDVCSRELLSKQTRGRRIGLYDQEADVKNVIRPIALKPPHRHILSYIYAFDILY